MKIPLFKTNCPSSVTEGVDTYAVCHELCTCMAVLEYVMIEFLIFMNENKSVHVA